MTWLNVIKFAKKKKKRNYLIIDMHVVFNTPHKTSCVLEIFANLDLMVSVFFKW